MISDVYMTSYYLKPTLLVHCEAGSVYACIGLHGTAIKIMAIMAQAAERANTVKDASRCLPSGESRKYRNNTEHLERNNMQT